MEGDSYESALLTELQALAGVPPGSDSFAIRCGAGMVAVVYKQWSSGPSDLKLEARYDDVARVLPGYRTPPAAGPVVATRPMDVHLRHEDRDDRVAKAQELNVEWQTGDPAFDDVVYVSTPGHSAEVLSAVLGTEVRGAVIGLFGLGFRKVAIDDDGVVRAEVTEFVVARPREGRGRDTLDAFARLITNLPVVTASGARHAPVPFAGATRLFAWTAGILLTIFCASSAVAASLLSPTENLLSFVAAVAGPWVAVWLGMPAFRAARKLHGRRVAAAMRGTSRAAVTADRAGWAAGLCALCVVAGVIYAAAVALFVLRH